MLENSNGNLSRLTVQAEPAEIDYGDVLAIAEFPGQLRVAHDEVSDGMRNADRRDFEARLRESR